jgi:hypothetical protein
MSRQPFGIRGDLTLIAVGATVGCGTSSAVRGGDSLAMMPDNPDALIQMRRSDCPGGQCSVYGVSIFMDGTVIYDGRANVGVIGQRRAKISAERVSALISTLDTMGFLDIPESCCVCHSSTAYQIVTVDYRPGSVQRTVIHDSGCSSAPQTVGALEREIDRATDVAKWTAPTANSSTIAANTSPPVGADDAVDNAKVLGDAKIGSTESTESAGSTGSAGSAGSIGSLGSTGSAAQASLGNGDKPRAPAAPGEADPLPDAPHPVPAAP